LARDVRVMNDLELIALPRPIPARSFRHRDSFRGGARGVSDPPRSIPRVLRNLRFASSASNARDKRRESIGDYCYSLSARFSIFRDACSEIIVLRASDY